MPPEQKTHIIIVAAGAGNRFGSNLPKQYHRLGDMPVLMHTINAFEGRGEIVLVISETMADYWSELCREYRFTSPRIVHGGATRFESVRNALDSIDLERDDLVLIHDGARPLVKADLINRVVDALAAGHNAVIPVVAVTDSLRMVKDGLCVAVDRNLFRSVQTPQGFLAETVVAAYRRRYEPEFTDDASVVEASGIPVFTVGGSPDNIKITSPRDLDIASVLFGHKGLKR